VKSSLILTLTREHAEVTTGKPGDQQTRHPGTKNPQFNTVSKVKQISLELESLVLVKLASIPNTVLKLSFREKELRRSSTSTGAKVGGSNDEIQDQQWATTAEPVDR
jgi:hypothetical protein